MSKYKYNYQGLTVSYPEFFLGIAVYIATVYLSGTEEHSQWLGTLSVKYLEFKLTRFA